MRLLFLILTASSLLAACTFEGLRSPGPSGEYAWTNRNKATPAQVLPELEQCGGGHQVLNVKAGESTDNARARISECMFAKGFYIKSGSGGTCSSPLYRVELPACMNAPVRPSEGYYGQALSPKAQERLELEMANAIKKYKAEEARYVSLSFGVGGVSFRNPAKLSNERTLLDASDCNAFQKAVKSSDPALLQKEKFQSVECMLAKGYPIENEKWVCSWPGWREGISACASYAKAFAEDQKRVYDTVKTEDWPYVPFEFMNPKMKVMSIFRQEQLSCWKGKGQNNSKELEKLRIQGIECMLDKGYVLSEPETQRLCRNVDYKNTLSSCLGLRK
jgi:hypothetical protein